MIEPTDEMRMVAYRDAREWAAVHGHPQPDDRMIDDVLAAVLAIVERDYLGVMRDLVDVDACWFDHHGGCQAHGFLHLEPGEKCPHAAAKELLGMQPGMTPEQNREMRQSMNADGEL